MNKTTRYNSNTIFYLPALRTILFIAFGLLLISVPPFKGKNLEEASKWWPILCIVVNIITIIILIVLTKGDRKSFRELINHIPDKKKTIAEIFTVIPIMLILGIGGLVGISWLVYGFMPVTTTQPLPVWLAILVLLLFPVTVIFAEIPLYLGYCAPQIKEKTKNEVLSIIYPLSFYALQHCFMPLIFDFKHMLSRLLMFIPLLIFIGLWYYKNKDLLPLIAGHGLLDVFAGIQLLVVSLYPSIFEMMINQVD